jgi:hypothetical protein
LRSAHRPDARSSRRLCTWIRPPDGGVGCTADRTESGCHRGKA